MKMTDQNPAAIANRALSSLAHEINNAVQSIDGGNDLVGEALKRKKLEDVEQIWRMALHKQRKLSNIFLDLLFLSQAAIPHSALIHLSEIVDRTIRATARQAEFCRVEIHCPPIDRTSENQTYPEILQRCLSNVLDACIEACTKNPAGVNSIRVEVDPDPEFASAVLRIVDNGEAMTDIDMISFRDPLAAGEQFNRFGLSMAVARIIAQHLGGTIDIQNNFDSGCTTTLTLGQCDSSGYPDKN